MGHHFGGIAKFIQNKNTIRKVNNPPKKCFRWHCHHFNNTIRCDILGYTAFKKLAPETGRVLGVAIEKIARPKQCFFTTAIRIKQLEKEKTWETRMNSKYSVNSDPAKLMVLKKSRFTEMLIEANALDPSAFESWIFCHGMLFNCQDKWWGDYGQRDYPHEGIDLCLYSDRKQKIGRMGETTRIPLMHDGVVKAIFKDYLGQSVVLEHNNSNSKFGKLISMYAHTNPCSGIEIGSFLKEGDIIATLGDTRNLKSNIIPHLHFSLGLPSQSFSYDRFVWNTIRNPNMITLLDPLPVIDWPYRAADGVNPPCCEL